MSKEELDWLRAKRDETDLSTRRIFDSRCRRYKVIQSVGKFTGMGTVWYAIHCEPNQTIISKHRAKGAAQRACEKHLNPPKKRRKS